MNAPIEAHRDGRGLVLAVDGGGTSTRAVVVTADGRCVGYGAAGSGNATSGGLDVAAASIAAASRQAAGQADVDLSTIAIAVGALAGTDQFDDSVARAVAAAGGPPGFRLAADLLAMYLSGTTVGDGVVLLAGTGAIGGRVVDHTLERVVDGLGWLLGDEGSAFSIGRAVVRAVGAMLDGRRPSTALVDLVLAQLSGDAVHGNLYRSHPLRRLLAAVYGENPVSLAKFAPVAFTAAAAGDPAATAIVDAATDTLANTLRAALVDDESLVGPLVLGGGVLAANPQLGDEIAMRVADGRHRFDVIGVSDGVVGAAQLALRSAGYPVDATVLATITDSLATLRPSR